jgi:hypothetical protein
VEEVEGSGSRASSKPILRLSERNEEDTGWTRPDGTKPTSGKNKMTVEVMVTVRKRKELIRSEVAKNELVDSWLRDHIKPERLGPISAAFPRAGKYSPKQQWVLMTEDANSPYRYQQYGLTVRLNPDKDDRLIVAGQKDTLHTHTHWKGGRRDSLECGGNGLPVSQRTVHHLNRSCTC